MIKAILSGANGHMGKVISSIVKDDPDISICAGFDVNTLSEDGFPVYCDPKQFQGKCDVIIDFSHPSAFAPLLDFAVKRKIPIIFATTGLSEEQREEMKKAAEKTAVFFSANMSIGVNLLIDLVKKATSALAGGYDIEIIEKHHNRKIDAPSGTALAIANAISDVSEGNPEYVYDRHSVRRKRAKSEIGIHSVRGGTIVGEHDVIFAGTDELIEIKHTALSREIFAVGAVRAAKFMSGKPAGFYDMTDLLAD